MDCIAFPVMPESACLFTSWMRNSPVHSNAVPHGCTLSAAHLSDEDETVDHKHAHSPKRGVSEAPSAVPVPTHL